MPAPAPADAATVPPPVGAPEWALPPTGGFPSDSGAAGAPADGALPDAAEPADAGKPVDVRLWAGVGSAGLGAVSLIAMGVAFGQISSLQDDAGFVAYRAGLTHDQHACELAAAGHVVAGASTPADVDGLCGSASTWESTGTAMAAIGGVALAAGAALIVTSDTVWPKLVGPKPTEPEPMDTPDAATTGGAGSTDALDAPAGTVPPVDGASPAAPGSGPPPAGPPPTAWRLTPLLGPEGAGATLRYRF